MTQAILQRQQAYWDWRAAANFMAGGAGAGLLVVAVAAGARGTQLQVVAAAGLALWNFGVLENYSPSLHALSVGAMSGLILAMISRVTLGHTGRPLQLPAGIVWAFVLFNIGVAARVFLTVAWPVAGLWLAAGCWAIAFALYAWRYAPMLLAPRLDGHPG